MRKTVRYAQIVALVCACALATGCGSDDESTAGATTSSNAASQASGVDEAKRNVAEASKVPSDIGVSEPLKGSVKGKRAAVVACGLPVCAQALPLLEEPLKKLGFEAKTYNAGTTPDSITRAFNSARDAKPDVVIDFAVPVALWANQAKALADADVPLIITAAAIPDDMRELVTAEFFGTEARKSFGERQADWVTARSNGEGKAVFVWPPELLGLKDQAESFAQTLKSRCPSCSSEELSVKAADVGRTIPGQIVSYLQRNPDTKYVVASTGDMLTGVPEALKAAGIEGVEMISSTGGPTNYQYIQRGEQTADLGAFLDVYLWQVADAAARGVLGQDQPEPPMATQWFTEETATFDPKTLAPFGSDFRAEFEKLWAGEAS